MDPEEKELSAIWRSVLDEILEEDDEAEELLRLVKTASSRDIRFFLRNYGLNFSNPMSVVMRVSTEDGSVTERLKSYGLLRRPLNLPILWIFLGLFGMSLLFFVGSKPADIFGPGSAVTSGVPILFSLVGSGLIILLVALNWYVPSRLGMRLSRLYREYSGKS